MLSLCHPSAGRQLHVTTIQPSSPIDGACHRSGPLARATITVGADGALWLTHVVKPWRHRSHHDSWTGDEPVPPCQPPHDSAATGARAISGRDNNIWFTESDRQPVAVRWAASPWPARLTRLHRSRGPPPSFPTASPPGPTAPFGSRRTWATRSADHHRRRRSAKEAASTTKGPDARERDRRAKSDQLRGHGGGIYTNGSSPRELDA